MAMNSSAVRVIDPVLSTVAQGYRQPELVGSVLFPSVPVEVSGGQVLEFGREAFRTYRLRRAPGAATKRVTFGYLGKSYSLLEDAVEVPVPREHLRDAARVPGVDLGTRATRLGMRILQLALEVEQASLALASGNYAVANTTALAEADRWGQADVNPKTSINTGREAIRNAVGMDPNVLLLGPTAFNALRENPAVIERFKYTGRESVTAEMLASLFDFERVVVGRGVTSDAAGTNTDIWGNNAVLAYVPQASLGMEDPSYGYTYAMQGHPLVEQPYWDPNTKSWIYGVTYERAPVLAGMEAGYLIQTAG